jgi:hypothetical protein
MARVELHYTPLEDEALAPGELGFDPFRGTWRYVAVAWHVDLSMGAATVATALDLLPDGDWYVIVEFRTERTSFRVPQLGFRPKKEQLKLRLRASAKPLQGSTSPPDWAEGVQYETFSADSFWRRL